MTEKLLNYDLKSLSENPLGEDFNLACRKTAGEGIVMLRNENSTLPLKKGTRVSVFGRMQNSYIRSGTGSGGLVNVEYTIGIPQGLENAGLLLNADLRRIYSEWEKENPIDNGNGWATEPWFQTEMPIDGAIASAAAEQSDAAVVIIGRTAGEDKDNKNTEGSYLLTAAEKNMLSIVRSNFKKVIVLLNVGNIIDMKWVDEYSPDAVLYAWQDGQEGGNAVGDVITGAVSPSGKLSDSIAFNIEDYPSTANFDGDEKNIYSEDIYVGYRYFNTFAKEKVIYPFGFGLSYTCFDYSGIDFILNGRDASVELTVKNIGNFSGKEVIQIYLSAPQGKLGKPERVLAAYKKTETLSPSAEERVKIEFSLGDFASFDDTGVTGFESSFVLEKGEYKVFVSTDSLTDKEVFKFTLRDDILVEKCSKAMSPKESFERIKPILNGKKYEITKETVRASLEEVNKNSDNVVIPFTGDKGISLADVKNGKSDLKSFIAQLSDEDLAAIAIGEGMNSPKVTAGTGCAFGGLTESLKSFGIPVACGTDGPSGIRMDSGKRATLVPNGTLLACTWNDDLIEELYTYEGIEMYAYKIDALLGPGINIHRNPLNGRNFEYFSEDPLISGNIAAAICKGIAKSGNTAVIKHFCANNQEKNRHNVDSVVSERALREIYLKPFEIALKDGSCKAVMTSYNPVNGVWSCGNYDLNTVILSDEWGFGGFVMSDWWAKTEKDFIVWGRNENTPPRNFEPMVTAQNDIYMVNPKADDFEFNTILGDIKSGKIKRADARRNAMNVCGYLMNTNAMARLEKSGATVSDGNGEHKTLVAEFSDFMPEIAEEFVAKKGGKYIIEIELISNGAQLSQNTVTFFSDGEYLTSLTVSGTCGKPEAFTREVSFGKGVHKLSCKYPEGKFDIKRVYIYETGF